MLGQSEVGLLDGTTRPLDPAARTRWAIERSVLWVVMGLVATVAALASDASGWALGAVVVTLVAVAISVVSAGLSYRYWSWAAHDDAVQLTHGIIVRHVSLVPYHRIQQIDIERGPLERVLGISTLILRSAAATTDAKIPGIAAASADPLRHALLHRTGADDAV